MEEEGKSGECWFSPELWAPWTVFQVNCVMFPEPVNWAHYLALGRRSEKYEDEGNASTSVK